MTNTQPSFHAIGFAMLHLIDGYNLLYAVGYARPSATSKQFQRAREKMLEWLNEAHPSPENILVVFDAHKASRPTIGEQISGKIRVRYSHKMIADDLIEDMIRAAARPTLITVVSNDTRLQESGRRRGCVIWRTEDLIDWMQPPTPTKVLIEEEFTKPDKVNPAEIAEYLDVFGDADDDDMLDRRGFNAPK